MRLADIDAVTALEREIFSDAWSRDTFHQEVVNTRGTMPVVLEDNETGDLLAYMVAWTVADEAHLGNVAVVPARRGEGLAQRLLDYLESAARGRAARMIVLEVRRSNTPARRLYEKNGYYPVMVRKRYYADNKEDALVMVKPLDKSGRLRRLEDEALPEGEV